MIGRIWSLAISRRLCVVPSNERSTSNNGNRRNNESNDKHIYGFWWWQSSAFTTFHWTGPVYVLYHVGASNEWRREIDATSTYIFNRHRSNILWQCIYLNSIWNSLSCEVEAHCRSTQLLAKLGGFWSANQYLANSLNTLRQRISKYLMNNLISNSLHILLPAQWNLQFRPIANYVMRYEIRHELRPQFNCNESFHASEVGFHILPSS